jgi:hypothetical protein
MATRKNDDENANATGTDLERKIPQYTDEELLSIQSFDDALRLAADWYGEENLVRADATIGNGFQLLANKDTLIDVPLVILQWRFNPGNFGEFVSMMIVTKDGRKFVVNDGGSGICAQLATYTNATGRHGGMLVAKGFTRSDYTYEDEKGEEHPASTYYLNTSA